MPSLAMAAARRPGREAALLRAAPDFSRGDYPAPTNSRACANIAGIV
jgi:hypothetical protein